MTDSTLTRDPLGVLPLTGQQRQIEAKVVVVRGPDTGLEVALEDVVEVGSGDRVDLKLTDKSVSRRHLRVAIIDGRMLVKDLGSRNGTFVDGTRLVEGEIGLGTVLTLGDSALSLQPQWMQRRVTPSSARQFGQLVGESLAMRELFALLERAAPTELPILVEGESGVGKELVCRAVHEQSARRDGPYVVFDCSAVARELADAELFGHVRGAFTGAHETRAGAFERADGGTLCLDEIGELPLELQPKLLRVLERSEVRRVGETDPRAVDVRVLAATNRDLDAEVRRGAFRPDLLFRLDVVRAAVPPLRRRLDDLPQLVRAVGGDELADGLVEGPNLDRLMAYGWPGNVRELRNVVRRALALSAHKPASFADLDIDLGPAASGPAIIGASYPGVASPMPFKDAKAQLLESFERSYVEALLSRHNGNIARSAAAAELSRKHLYELIRRTGARDGDDDS
ncbi:MAG: sigma 54-dependent Fis family transcriptional regulator [Myxococcales bacterium]|nr:sigma 54-dependent Fis family transcriptional regulator [Myxococcales bacterium]